MSTGIETHRSMVKAWECDSFGHFTVAYYFDRIADASATAREALSIPEGWMPAEYTARFISELRAGEVFHVESGVIAVEDVALRLGHSLINSATGNVCSTIEERLAANAGSRGLSTRDREALRARAVT
ncbi:MAG TPA: thioesterase family protein [Stellaceae bacterium]|nr:thioesterase family protein [Stellaceae bacterium]